MTRRQFFAFIALQPPPRRGLDPLGRMHIPIGIPDSLDTLKTFVEAEGPFSPGFGSYGVYFWLGKLGGEIVAPTMDTVASEHGLSEGGLLIPWVRWSYWDTEVTQRVCQVAGDPQLVAVRIDVRAPRHARLRLAAAVRPLGPAGWHIANMQADRDALLVGGHPALVAFENPSWIGTGAVDLEASRETAAFSPTGDCWGLMEFELDGPRRFEFVCPVLAGRRAARHGWVDRGQNALVDDAELNPPEGGVPQRDPGLAYFRKLRVPRLFERARRDGEALVGRFDIDVPDPRWRESLRAILGHAALTLNEGAPDVAVVNYNVFNRDGLYIANMMQKAGCFETAVRAIEYFLAHPFNGRAYPESDNPGQVLWCLSEHWQFTRDREWLERVYPRARRVAELIEYYRTTPGPYWVSGSGLDFGPGAANRLELKPGRCDGYHPEYTEAFDVAGLRAAALLASAAGAAGDAARFGALAERLFGDYDRKFRADLRRQYGSYCVLWPCRLYPLGHAQFRGIGAQKPTSWRYFPLATAHQGLLAGNRAAGHGTLEIHLAHEQMRGWYAFDEGGGSGSGGWHKVRTNWPRCVEKPGENLSVAMPHGWAIAEFWLLLRDSLVYEDGDKLVLFAGVPEGWFGSEFGFRNLRTYWGPCTARWRRGRLEVSGAKPPGGFVVTAPATRASHGQGSYATLGNLDCRGRAGAGRLHV